MKSDTVSEIALPRPIRRRLWKTLLLLGVFAGGLISGGVLTAVTIISRVREAINTPEKTAERIVSRMTHRLDLTDEQADQIRAAVRRNMREFNGYRVGMRAQVAGQIQTVRQEISGVLTSEQEQQFNQRFNRLQKLWMPPSAQ